MIRLEISERMLMVISNALGNHPFREAAPVIAELQKQVSQQDPQVQQPVAGNGAERRVEGQ